MAARTASPRKDYAKERESQDRASLVGAASQYFDTVPPQDLEAERIVLSCCLGASAAIDEAALILSEDDYYSDAHRKIWANLYEMHQAGQGVDIFTVAQRLKAQNLLDEVGGVPVLNCIQESGGNAIFVSEYARTVKQLSYRRRAVHAMMTGLRAAYNLSEDYEATVQEIEGTVTNLIEVNARPTVQDVAAVLGDLFAAFNSPAPVGIETGMADIDTTLGNYRPGQLIIMAARPGMGKTALAGKQAMNIASRGNAVLFFTLELTKLELCSRLCSNRTGITTHNLNRPHTLTPQDHDALIDASQEMAAWPLHIDERSGITMRQIASTCRLMKRRHHIKVVFVDYLQLIEPADLRVSREQQVSRISRELKNLAKELQVPIVALAQLNREVENRTGDARKPRMADLRESGDIENNADVVMFLHREAYYMDSSDPNYHEEIHRSEILIRKNRGGETGTRHLYCNMARYEFAGLASPNGSSNQLHITANGNAYYPDAFQDDF